MSDKIVKAIYTVLFIVSLFIVLLLVLSRFSIPGVPRVYVVQSGSMEPSIKTGSIVVVRESSSYDIGDVITFSNRASATPVTHRIVEKSDEGRRISFVTKGDANEDIDSRPVSSSSVIGKVMFDVPILGFIVAAAKKPLGFLVIIGIPAIMILYDEIQKIRKEVKKLRSRKKQQMVKRPSKKLATKRT